MEVQQGMGRRGMKAGESWNIVIGKETKCIVTDHDQ
jgi:hypothetical protein